MLDILVDAMLDSVKLIPFLFVTYLIMEYLEHKTSEKHTEKIQKSGKMGPVVGALLGAFPQCGFSVSATNLFVGRVISVGTLLAVYLSTSDEMIPVFLAENIGVKVIVKVVGLKILLGMLVGLMLDFVFPKDKTENTISHLCEHHHCHCEEGIIKSSIRHTVNITGFIFVISLALNAVIAVVGEETIAHFILNKPILGPIIAGLVGLIPNCAASVMLAELYIGQLISAGAMMAGLLVGAGVGLLVLVKENRDKKENLKIISILYVTGVGLGILLEFLGLTL